MNALDYFLKANLYGLLFAGCYYLLLRRHTFFRLNRAYLLASAVLSLTLPLVHLPAETVETPFMPTGVIALPMTTVSTLPAANGPDWEMVGYLSYVLIALVLTGLLARRLTRVLRLIRQSPRQVCNGYVLVQPGNPAVPTFSFFGQLVINPADRQNDIIIRHELVHIRQWHSADVLGLALLRAVFWTCPVLWLIDRALRQVHEFLADRTATKPTDYARFLVDYAFGLQPDRLTNGFFNPSLLKQRILMLHQRATTRWALGKYALVLPFVFGLLAMTTARKEITAVVDRVTDETITISGRVTDQSGKPLPGANVIVANTNRGTETDSDGRYHINALRNESLAFSFVGFNTQLIQIKGRKSLSVSLLQKTDKLSPVVITAYESSSPAAPLAVTATQPNTVTTREGEVFTVVEQVPEFPGGMSALGNYLIKNLRYPTEAYRNKVQGRVFVQFVVTATGATQQLRVLKGIGSGCDEEAVRVISQMPAWNPGKQSGKPVAVQYILPVQFALEKATPLPSPAAQPDSGKKQGFNTVGNQDLNSLFVRYNDAKTSGSTTRYAMPLPDSLRSFRSGALWVSSLGRDPLYIIDSVMWTGADLQKLNVNKIEHITVLKDAASIAMFGEKGRNGVIIITTKKP